MHEKEEKCIQSFGRRPSGRTARKREDNIKIDLKETGW
jgi:hypothetical protein